MVRILFVCLGNICRSPTAEGAMRALVRDAGMEADIEIDSAGTGGWHVGDPPDRRAVKAARARGIALEGTAREVSTEDFEDFDLLRRYRGMGVERVVTTLPPETADKTMPALDRWAELIRRVNA